MLLTNAVFMNVVIYVNGGASECFKTEQNYRLWMYPSTNKTPAISKEPPGTVLCVYDITYSQTGLYGAVTKNGSMYLWNLEIQRNPTDMYITNESTDSRIFINDGFPLVLECKITIGKPEGILQWTHEGIVLTRESINGYLRLVLPYNGNQNGKVYTCEALNDQNEKVLTRNITVSVKVRTPSQPRNVSFISYQESIYLSWKPPITTSKLQLSYTVEYGEVGKEKSISELSHEHIILTGLDPGVEYAIQIYAENDAGPSNKTKTYFIRTESYEKIDIKPNPLLWPFICTSSFLVLQVLLTLVFLIRCRLQRKGQEQQEMLFETPMTINTETIASSQYDEINNTTLQETLSNSNTQYIDMQDIQHNRYDGTDNRDVDSNLNSRQNNLVSGSGTIDSDGYLLANNSCN